jgi:hypothetical protein
MEIWSIGWAVRNLLSELLTSPGILIVWVLLMLFLIKKHERIKKSSHHFWSFDDLDHEYQLLCGSVH